VLLSHFPHLYAFATHGSSSHMVCLSSYMRLVRVFQHTAQWPG
jgi:hypothetical protein